LTLMKQKIVRWLQPPVFEGDDTKTSRAELLNEVILVSIALVALFVFGSFPPCQNDLLHLPLLV